METGSKDKLSWLHGLEDYLNFTNNKDAEDYVRLFLNLNYADDPFFPLKKLLTLSHNLSLNEEEYNRTISLFLNSFKSISTDIDSELDLIEWNKVAMTIFPLIVLPLMILGGFFVNNNDIFVWLRWIEWMSMFKWGF